MKKRIFVLLLALVMALGLTVTAAADLPKVNYIDPTKPADQQAQTCTDYTVVESSGSMVTWSAGWYVVNSDVTINNYVTVNGDVKLILLDGKTLTVKGGLVGSENIYGIYLASGASLTVYGQSGGTGTLDVLKVGYNQYMASGAEIQPGGSTAIALNGGRLTINGGHVKASVAINTGKLYGLGSGTLIMNGGKLTAISRKAGEAEDNDPISENITIQSDCCKWRTKDTDDYTAGSTTIPRNFTPAYTSEMNDVAKYLQIVAGHEFDTVVQATPTTCTTDGNRGHLQCSLCGKETDAAGNEIAANENLTIPATGHQFVGRTCTVCGYEQPGHEPIRRQNTTAVEDTADTTDTTVVASPKTFDVGVAVYGAMAITSLLGMGYVGKKRA